jgi:hypothetical protein
VIRPGVIRQVESGETVRSAATESANQFTLGRRRVPIAPATVIAHTVVSTGRIGIDIVKRIDVGIDTESGRNATVRRRTARWARTRGGRLGTVPTRMSCAAAATTATVMPRAFANHVRFHRNWAGGTMEFET